MIGVSLFSSAGIAEQYLNELGINIVVANELIQERAALYRAQYPNTNMICGDITDDKTYKQILTSSPDKIDILLASPPCQGMSIAGKNKTQAQMGSDKRNYLIFKVIDFIKIKKPKFVLIENVPRFFTIKLPHNGKYVKIADILKEQFSDIYNIDYTIYDTADYGIAQRRTRAITRLYMKGSTWGIPKKERTVTVKDAIGHLPSLESGEKSAYKWHYARKHTTSQIECMKHTATGHSAMENKIYYPKNQNGERIKAYNTTYKRMKWDEPAPTITIRNDAISSQMNVHPGKKKDDGTYSDARVLTPLELMLLSSIPENWNIPDDTPELLIRKCIGECIPPLMVKKIFAEINS